MSLDFMTRLRKFNPDEHKGNGLDAFNDFLEALHYEYEAVAKSPPAGDGEDAWIHQNKRKLFLGKYASRNLQKDYEAATTSTERTPMTFDTMVTKLKAYYEPTKNNTLANYEFHQLKQIHGLRYYFAFACFCEMPFFTIPLAEWAGW